MTNELNETGVGTAIRVAVDHSLHRRFGDYGNFCAVIVLNKGADYEAKNLGNIQLRHLKAQYAMGFSELPVVCTFTVNGQIQIELVNVNIEEMFPTLLKEEAV